MHGGWDTEFDAENWWKWDEESNGIPLTQEEIQRRESRLRIDSVWDIVPFWRRGVEAADRGEVLNMEAFLESISQLSWESNNTDNWGYAYSPSGWKVAGAGSGCSWRSVSELWNKPVENQAPEGSASSRRTNMTRSHYAEDEGREGVRTKRKGGRHRDAHRIFKRGKSSPHEHENAYDFVEDIARQETADAERKRRMHDFFEVRVCAGKRCLSHVFTQADVHPGKDQED
jgi:hypothetical protein